MVLIGWWTACAEAPVCGPGTTLVDGVCVADEAEDDPTPAPGDDDDDDDDDVVTVTEPGGPTILSVSTNVTRMTDDDTLRVTAIVTDPDGIDDLIGGELLAPDGATYGAFATSAQEGAYEIVLAWGDLDVVESITFDHDEPVRTFEVRFYDQGGHIAAVPLDLTLYCDEGSACDGTCVDLDVDEGSCGTCGNSCVIASNFSDQCQQGACVVESACAHSFDQTCDQICAADGMTCTMLTYQGAPVLAWADVYSDRCDSSEGWWVYGQQAGCGDRLQPWVTGGELRSEGVSCLCIP